MASTNKTPNLGLSQFQPLDKPAWLGDYNQDMSKIDTAVHNNQTKVDSMETNVNVAISSADAATKAAQAATEAAAEATSVAQNAQTTANNVSGTATQSLSIAQQAQETAESAQTTANNALPKSGGTMTGPLILSGAPTQNNQAATKAYVDNAKSSETVIYLTSSNLGPKISSSIFSGAIVVFNNSLYIFGNFSNTSELSGTDIIFTVTLPKSIGTTQRSLAVCATSTNGAINNISLSAVDSTLTLQSSGNPINTNSYLFWGFLSWEV